MSFTVVFDPILGRLVTSRNPSSADIKAQYESNPDTNAFTDREKAALAEIDSIENSWQGVTTNAVQTELFISGVSGTRLVIPQGSARNYGIGLVAYEVVGNKAGSWNFTGVVKHSADGTVAIVDGDTVDEVINEIGCPTPVVMVDLVNKALVIKVTGLAATTINWFAADMHTSNSVERALAAHKLEVNPHTQYVKSVPIEGVSQAITNIVSLTEAQYAALETKDPMTLYVVLS